MDKIKLYATYNGQCYLKGYRGKFYRKGVELIDIEDCKMYAIENGFCEFDYYC